MADVLAAVSGRTSELNDSEEAKPTHTWGALATHQGGMTPSYDGMDIFRACQVGDMGVVVLLWYKGVSATFRDSTGATPLHQAAFHGHLKICKFLLDQGAEIDAVNNLQATPIMWATSGSHHEVVVYLASRGASLTRVDHQGHSVPFHAVHTNQAALLHWVACEQEFDWNTQDNAGHNLFQWAAYKGYLGCCRYLAEERRVNTEVLDNEGRTSLHWAARQGHQEVVQYLLARSDCSMLLNMRDHSGQTPAEAADSKFHKQVSAVLRAAGRKEAVPRHDAGREASTALLMLRNFSHLRRALLGALATAAFFFYASSFLPAAATLLGVPLLLIVPAALDAHLFRGGQPPVRPDGQDPSAELQQQAPLLAAGERNMSAFAGVVLLQLLLPLRFFYFNTPEYNATDIFGFNVASQATAPAAFLAKVDPGLAAFVWRSWVAAVVMFVAASAVPPGAPELPETDVESGARRIPTTPGAYCFELMQRKSLRSVYSRLTNRVVAGYDHFSAPLDADIGMRNRLPYILLLLFTICWTGGMFWGTMVWATQHVAGPAAQYTVCRMAGYMLMSGLPAGDPSRTSTLLPTQNEVTGAWCGLLPLIVGLLAAERLYLQLSNIGAGVTFHEVAVQITVPVSRKGLESLFIRQGKKTVSIFASRSTLAGILAFFTGTDRGYNKVAEVESTKAWHMRNS